MIGRHIRQLREDKGYILRQMAAMLDIDPTILSKMEREERPLKKENIIKIAEICDVNADELITMWLADKICDVVEGEDLCLDAIKLAVKQIDGKRLEK